MTRVHAAFAALILVEILVLFLGCRGDKNDPLQPTLRPNTQDMVSDAVPPSSPGATVMESANTPALWGLYQVAYSAELHDISVVPLRGPAFAWNVVKFLQPPAGSPNNMMIGILDDSRFWETGRIDVRVILHHPFPGQPVYTGFDVCGVFLTEASLVSPYDADLTYAYPWTDPILINPDGYTRWMNPTEFLTGDVFGYEPGFWGTSESSENSGFVAGATINPYKYFAHGLGPDESLADWLALPGTLDNRGMFPSGASCARDYEVQFPIVDENIVFIFNYAVLANWTAPEIEPPNDPIRDFPHSANARYPVHVLATDRSHVYYMPEEAGGALAFDLEIFDWDAFHTPAEIPGEVAGFVLWSDQPLVPGGWVELTPMEVEWNSGFTASSSVATVELTGAVPEAVGESHVWIAIESAHPSSYDQGFGAMVPDDPIATYVRVPIEVANCPKAFVTGMDTNVGGRGDRLDDVNINGTNFVNGDELAVWLELKEAGGSSGPASSYQIHGTDVRYVNRENITADFDLTDAPFGHYGAGCVNGCGAVTTPEDNEEWGYRAEFEVTLPSPDNLALSTGRNYPTPTDISSLTVTWSAVEDAQFYRIYALGYNIHGDLVIDGMLGSTTNTEYEISLPSLPLGGSGHLDVRVTAVGEVGNEVYESLPSSHGHLYFQDFETAMGEWELLAETPYELRFVRSTVDGAYSGYWGIKCLGAVPWYPARWTVLASPAIPEDDASTAHFEFLHRYKGIYPSNGYQVGWCHGLPSDGDPVVDDYYPIISVAYGFPYNDADCTALQSEFGVTAGTDQNYQSNVDHWVGWYLSGFDASAMLGDSQADHVMIGFAGDYYDLPDVCIDDAAILVY